MTIALFALKIRGALILSIAISTVIALVLGVAKVSGNLFGTYSFGTSGQFDLGASFSTLGIGLALLTIFSIMLIDFFDRMGTVTGVAEQAGLTAEDGRVPGVGRVLLVDSIAAAVGALAGTSSNTTYIESAAGVAEGGRHGFTAVVVGILFLAAILLSPLAGIVPASATAPVLILVGFLMFTLVGDINVRDFEDGFPALLTMILMPLAVGRSSSWSVVRPAKSTCPCGSCRLRSSSPSLSHGSRACSKPRQSRSRHTFGSEHGAPTRRAFGRLPVPSAAMFERTALPSGPRVISARLPGVRSVSIAAYVLAGSRLETAAEVGAAHFMEHITFKGTERFPTTRAISEAIEGVGGSFNAATDRESTVYWVRVPRREATRAMDVLGELIVRPTLAAGEIEGERDVIVEEIRSYLDDPVEHGQMLFQRSMFGDGPLGREICGDEAGVRSLPADAIRSFWRATYRPANTVVAVAGDIDHERSVELAAAAFGSGNGTVPPFAEAPTLPAGERFVFGARRDVSQAQLYLGVPALRRDHPDAWILAVLNAVLGDGMSSRLFLSVREERGLAYDVSSGVSDYADAGALEISAGVDPARTGDALDAILVELARLRDEPVPDDELAKAKAYLSGGLELRMDETRHVASWIGGQEALHERVLTLDEALAAVAAVEAGDVRRLAGELFRDEGLRMALVAPARHGRGLERRLRLPA